MPLESGEGSTTLLTWMVYKKANLATIEFLIQNGANPRGLGQRDALRPPLAYAIYRKDLALAKLLLEAGTNPDVMFRNKEGRVTRPLIEIALWPNDDPDKSEWTRMLLDKNASPKLPHGTELDAVTVAAARGDLRLLKLYEQYGFDLTRQLRGGSYPVHHAALSGHTEVVRFLLERGVPADQRNASAETPLQYLIYYMNEEMPVERALAVIDELASADADMDAKNQENDTVLAVATVRGNRELVKSLLEKGATPNNARLGLVAASASRADETILRLLLQSGANPNRPISEGGPLPLWIAVGGSDEPDDITIEKILVEAGADLNMKSTEARSSALWLASTNGKPKTLAFLVEAGAEVNGIASEGQNLTALHGAVVMNDPETVEILLENGADPNATIKDGWTPLLFSAWYSSEIEIAEALIAKGAKVNAQNISDATALHYAALKGNLPMIQLLMDSGADPHLANKFGRDAMEEAKHNDQWQARTLINELISERGTSTQASTSGLYPAAPTPAPKPGYTTCNTRCINGDCYRTYSDGAQKRFQAKRVFNSLSGQWEYDSGSC